MGVAGKAGVIGRESAHRAVASPVTAAMGSGTRVFSGGLAGNHGAIGVGQAGNTVCEGAHRQ